MEKSDQSIMLVVVHWRLGPSGWRPSEGLHTRELQTTDPSDRHADQDKLVLQGPKLQSLRLSRSGFQSVHRSCCNIRKLLKEKIILPLKKKQTLIQHNYWANESQDNFVVSHRRSALKGTHSRWHKSGPFQNKCFVNWTVYWRHDFREWRELSVLLETKEAVRLLWLTVPRNLCKCQYHILDTLVALTMPLFLNRLFWEDSSSFSTFNKMHFGLDGMMMWGMSSDVWLTH